MQIRITCKGCGKQFLVSAALAGKKFSCPNVSCDREYIVPRPVLDAALPPKSQIAGESASRSKSADAPPPPPPWMKIANRDGQPNPAARTPANTASRTNAAKRPQATVPKSRPAQSAAPAKPPRPKQAAQSANQPQRTRQSPTPSQPGAASVQPKRGAPPIPGSVANRFEQAEQSGKQSSNRRPLRWVVTGAATTVAIAVCVFAAFHFLGSPDSRANADQPVEPGAGAPVAKQEQIDQFNEHLVPFFNKYCSDCHNVDDPEGGIDVAALDPKDITSKDRKKWAAMLSMLKINAMPPSDVDQPTKDETKLVVDWIDERLNNFDCKLVDDPGRVTIRRLNRSEYNNTIRDLVGVDFEPAKDFPSDDVGYGFDNIGDVLSLPPLLMEKYLDAAEQITAKAIVRDPYKSLAKRFAGGELISTGGRVSGGSVSLSSAGDAYKQFDFPADGEYIIRVEAMADQAGPDPARVVFQIDNRPIKTMDTKGQRKLAVLETRTRVKKGTHKVGAAFNNDYYQPNAKDPKLKGDRNLYVRYIEVEGPIGGAGPKLPATHSQIVIARPKEGESPRVAAEKVLKNFATRAFRRPAKDEEIAPLAQLVELVVENGDSFEHGIEIGVQAILVSPHFIFRVESDKTPDDPKAKHELTDYELATRLSYFLWSSMPDETLMRLAEQGQLNNPTTLRQQVKRMLADPKSKSLVDEFAVQWLNLRNLDEVSPDPTAFPVWNDGLKNDMRRETLMLFESIMQDDMSVLTFLDADFTFVNERLAKHYGMNSVTGDNFRKVTLDANRRKGVLTHASILTITSDPTRTSPVKRGKWILENILGTPPPDPPPNVPELEKVKAANPGASMRKQLLIHQENPGCASCHKALDPLGFGMENFDAIGRWRDQDGTLPVDASGVLPNGEKFNGPVELIRTLLKRDEDFSRFLTDRLMTFGLGRGLEFYDKCAVDKIMTALKADEFRFSTLVTEIVLSEPFRMRRGDGGISDE